MTKELRLVAVLIILMGVSLAGWRIVESQSVLISNDFLAKQADPLNPALNTSVLTQ